MDNGTRTQISSLGQLRQSKVVLTLAASLVAALVAGCGATRSVPNNQLGGDADHDGDNPLTDGGVVGFDVGGGGGGGGSGIGGDASLGLGLNIAPINDVKFIDIGPTPPVPATDTYTATEVASGASTDVTSSTTFSVADSTLGSFTGATFTSTTAPLPGGVLGVTTTVTGTEGGSSSVANLTLVRIRKTVDSTGARDFFFTVPYNEPPTPPNDVLKFGTKINQADVAFVVDTTGSMQGEIDNLTSSLSGTVVPGLNAAIPSVGLALVDHKDTLNADDFGEPDPWTVMVRQVVTTNVSSMQSALQAMDSAGASGGGDTPEAQIPAMQYTLLGQAIATDPAVATQTACAGGTYGGVCFRPGSVPVVVEVTDASWSTGEGGTSMATLEAAFAKQNAKFVLVGINLGGGDSPFGQGESLSDATASNLPASAVGGSCPETTAPNGNCRLIYTAQSDGTGVSTSIVSAIAAISVGSVYDIQAKLSNDSTNPGGVDATQFVAELRAMDEGDATEGCDAHAAYDSGGKGYDDTFKAVTVGTPVCFQIVAAENTKVAPTTSAQFFNAFIDMVGLPGDISLGDRRTVVFLVPPSAPHIVN